MQAISPNDPALSPKKRIPHFIVKAFNELIVEKFDGRSSVIQKDLVINRICESSDRSASDLRAEIFDKNWLDVEPLYEEQGWKVEFHKPAIDEKYDAYFKFIKEKQ